MYGENDGPPPLVDSGPMIPPPPGATVGGQPAAALWPPSMGAYQPFGQHPNEPPPPWLNESSQAHQGMYMQGRYPSFGPPHQQQQPSTPYHGHPHTPYAPFTPQSQQQSPWSAPTLAASNSFGPTTPGGSYGPVTPLSAGATRDDPWGIATAQHAHGMAPPNGGGGGGAHMHMHTSPHHLHHPHHPRPHLHHQNSYPPLSYDPAPGHPTGAEFFNGFRSGTPFHGTPGRKKSKRGRSKSRSRPGTPFIDHGDGGDGDPDDVFGGGFVPPPSAGPWPGFGGGGGGGFPLQRARSASAAIQNYGGGQGPMYPFGAHPQQAEFGEHNLARRPREWRAEFDAKAGLTAFIPRRHKSNVKEWYDNEKRHLTPLLESKTDKPNIFYDMRQDIYNFDRPSLYFPTLNRVANQIDLHQLATNPPCQGMRLFHPLLPWYIDVVQSQPNGITLEDVIFQIHHQLMESISDKDFWTDALPAEVRIKISVVFSGRVHGDAEAWKLGIKRIDYLRDNCIFEGLVRSKGMWEMKTRHLEEYKGFSKP